MTPTSQREMRNGQTSSGLYIVCSYLWNGTYEGFIDTYGLPVFDTPKTDLIKGRRRKLDMNIRCY